MPHTVLVVGDDSAVVELMDRSLRLRGYGVEGPTSVDEALPRIRSVAADLVITEVDANSGIGILQALLRGRPEQLVMALTEGGSMDLGLAMIRAGACDVLTKPLTAERLVLAVERALSDRPARREGARATMTAVPLDAFGFVARSPAMHRALEAVQRSAGCDSTVLLTGETGTGKSALARLIHEGSGRRAQPFVHLNCAALPAHLIESELFGVRRGAFTDAREDRMGLFVAAGRGTLFLDEVAELPIETQATLLHVLEANMVRPLGGTSEVRVRARVLAATNRPLEALVRSGGFRKDLYYRLNVVRIEIPPLRERREDILPLADHFLKRVGLRPGAPVGVSPGAVRRLLSHHWPGNLRELANVVERATVLSHHDTLVPEDIDFLVDGDGDDDDALLAQGLARHLPLEVIERTYVRRVMDAHKGNKAAAARVLGINRRTLYRMLSR